MKNIHAFHYKTDFERKKTDFLFVDKNQGKNHVIFYVIACKNWFFKVCLFVSSFFFKEILGKLFVMMDFLLVILWLHLTLKAFEFYRKFCRIFESKVLTKDFKKWFNGSELTRNGLKLSRYRESVLQTDYGF